MFGAIASGVVLSQQAAPSLGDIARKYRTEKIEHERELQEGAANHPAVETDATRYSEKISSPASPVAVPAYTTPEPASRHEAEVHTPAAAGVSTAPRTPQALPRTESAAPANIPDPGKSPALIIRENNQATKQATTLPNQPSASAAQQGPVAAGKASKDSGSEPAHAPVFPAAVAKPVSQRKTAIGTPELITVKSSAPVPAAAPVQFASTPQQNPVLIRTSATTRPAMAMDDIYKSISQNLRTPEGEKYNGVFAWEFSLKDSRVLKECLATGTNDPGPFDVVVEVSGDGKAQQAMIFPDTGVSGCLQHRLAATSFSPPPRPDYWVRVTLTK